MEPIRDVEPEITPKDQYRPINPKTYKTKTSKRVILIPLHNILITYKITKRLNELREKIGSKYLDLLTPNLKNKISSLNPKLRDLMVKFLNNDSDIKPVTVQRSYAINEPSIVNPIKPSVLGLETAQIYHQLRDVDYLYDPLNGYDEIALSIFFKYDHIPVIINI
ncbi:MAG: hypothetical protein ABIN35_00135 [candidate division WOR-3 bacterium]